MKLLIVRHGDPNYAIDSLTGKGWREAEYLSERLAKLPITKCYVSPLGRAQDTASLTLAKIDQKAEVKDWLQEFPSRIQRPDKDIPMITWDWLPGDWTKVEEFFREDQWLVPEVMQESTVPEDYKKVCLGLDELLADHGYVREGRYYRAEKPNNDTIVFFCHFGLECVLLSHLLNISPMVLWHGFCAAPSSVTTLNTEERREGIAYFRASAMGDISHLYVHGEEPSFAARFCECYANRNERHD